MTCHTKLPKLPADEDAGARGARLTGPGLESKFDELKYEVIHKIDKEMSDSQNAREYISQKYDELCAKIQFLTELDATVSGFRADVKAVERQVEELSARVAVIERRAVCRECPSRTSSMFSNK